MPSRLHPFALGTLLLACLLLPLRAAAQEEPVPSVEIEGETFVFLPQLATRYGVRLDWNPTAGVCVLRQDDRTVEGRLANARWFVDGRFQFGRWPLREYRGVPVIAAEDVPVVLGGALGREVSTVEVNALLGAGGAGAEPPAHPTLQTVRTIPYPRYLRLVLTFDAPIEYDVEQQGPRRLRVTLAGASTGTVVGPLEIGDDVVDVVGWKREGSDMVVSIVTQNPNPSYDAYYLEDPVRLILDFHRETEAAPLVAVPGSGGTPVAPQTEQPELKPPERAEFRTVVIDPGHGGRDPGAQGPDGIFEKTVTLQLAQALATELEKQGLEVVLTRNGDYFVSIPERTHIGNTARDGGPADLFISIHCNAHPSVRAGGFEAYFASEALDPSSEALASIENTAGEWNMQAPSPEADLLRQVLWDLQHAAYVEESNEFAVLAQENMGERLAIENRGVKQAPFLVLSGCAMPAVLIESGFITNRAEEVILQTPSFQKSVAEALAAAVAEFKTRRERRFGLAAAPEGR